MADLLAGRCHLCGRVTGADNGQPPYRCRCDRFDLLAARGGRLLAEYAGCESTGHYSLEIFRFDHPSGGRPYLCRSCWTDAWFAAGRPPQELLDDADLPAAQRRERSDPEGSIDPLVQIDPEVFEEIAEDMESPARRTAFPVRHAVRCGKCDSWPCCAHCGCDSKIDIDGRRSLTEDTP